MKIDTFLHAYLGNPYTKCDCWDLVRLFYAKVLNIDLLFVPDYGKPEDSAQYRERISNIVEIHKCRFEKVDKPIFGDVLLFNIMGVPAHVGVYIGSDRFVHSIKETGCVVESLSTTNWIKKLEGCYRWPE